jgi:hypothetical protein
MFKFVKKVSSSKKGSMSKEYFNAINKRQVQNSKIPGKCPKCNNVVNYGTWILDEAQSTYTCPGTNEEGCGYSISFLGKQDHALGYRSSE